MEVGDVINASAFEDSVTAAAEAAGTLIGVCFLVWVAFGLVRMGIRHMFAALQDDDALPTDAGWSSWGDYDPGFEVWQARPHMDGGWLVSGSDGTCWSFYVDEATAKAEADRLNRGGL